MFAYESLARCPSAFRSLTGMTPDEFDDLLTAFVAAHARRQRHRHTTRRGQPRQRAAGAAQAQGAGAEGTRAVSGPLAARGLARNPLSWWR